MLKDMGLPKTNAYFLTVSAWIESKGTVRTERYAKVLKCFFFFTFYDCIFESVQKHFSFSNHRYYPKESKFLKNSCKLQKKAAHCISDHFLDEKTNRS